jgi:hypothetical protein
VVYLERIVRKAASASEVNTIWQYNPDLLKEHDRDTGELIEAFHPELVAGMLSASGGDLDLPVQKFFLTTPTAVHEVPPNLTLSRIINKLLRATTEVHSKNVQLVS